MLCLIQGIWSEGRLKKQGVMLGVREIAWNVEKKVNRRNGLTARVCGEFLVIVIMLLEKKRERRFLTFADAG
jgi:hypothetical protein